jgi:superfamily II DNA or RNA helicase
VDYVDAFDPAVRSFQEKAIKWVVRRVIAEAPLSVCLIWCGSGKTLLYQAIATELMRLRIADRKRIKYLVVFAPRRNLAVQGETKWRAKVVDSKGRPVADPATGLPVPDTGDYLLFDHRCRLEYLRHRENHSPLIERGEAFVGYITTYQSLVADCTKDEDDGGQLHLKWAREHEGEFVLVGDEAQFLGAQADDDDLGSPAAGKYFAELAGHAAHTVLLTGQADRADGRKLALCDDLYEEDDKGRLHLKKKEIFIAGYSDGIAEDYLRRFDAVIHDAHIKLKKTGIEYDLSMASKQDPAERAALRDVLRDPKVWNPMVDRTVQRLRHVQKTKAKSRALIGCMSVADARDVERYLLSKDWGGGWKPRVKIAVSKDGAKAQNNLETFKTGDWDILVSVRMAFIGYDCPEITVVCVLTNYRDFGHLVQLVFRGGRVWSKGGTPERQRLHLIVPDDPAMQKFIQYLRDEQARGIKEPDEGPPPPPPGEPNEIDSAHVTDVRGATNDEDMSAEDFAKYQAALDASGPITTPQQLREAVQLWLVYGEAPPSQPLNPASIADAPDTPLTEKQIALIRRGDAYSKIGQFLYRHGFDPKKNPVAYQRAAFRLRRRINNAFGVNSAEEVTTADKAQDYLDHVRSFLRKEDEDGFQA